MIDWTSLRLPAFRVAAVAMVVLFGVLPAFAQQVIVRGNANVDREQIKGYVTRDGNLLDPAAAKAELDKVGFFPGSTVTRQGSNLVVTINAKSQISRVVFEGNNKLKTDTLESTVLSKTRGPFSEAVAEADVQRVKDLYRQQGRGHADVSLRVVDLPNGKVDVVFTVKENEKTGVKEIKFVGNNAVSNWRLKNIMTTTESNWLSFFKTSDIYDPDRVAADLEQIRRYYLKNGYADFRVVSSDAVFDEARGGYVLTDRARRRAAVSGRPGQCRIAYSGHRCRPATLRRAYLDGERLQRRARREDASKGSPASWGREATPSARRARSARATRRPIPSRSAISSRKVLGFSSSASTSRAIRARMTMSCVARSTSPRAMPTTRC